MKIYSIFTKKGRTYSDRKKRLFFQAIGDDGEIQTAKSCLISFYFLSFRIYYLFTTIPKIEPQFCSKFFIDIPVWVWFCSTKFRWFVSSGRYTGIKLFGFGDLKKYYFYENYQ